MVGAALMVVGVFIVLTPNFSGINMGDFLFWERRFLPPSAICTRKSPAHSVE